MNIANIIFITKNKIDYKIRFFIKRHINNNQSW